MKMPLEISFQQFVPMRGGELAVDMDVPVGRRSAMRRHATQSTGSAPAGRESHCQRLPACTAPQPCWCD